MTRRPTPLLGLAGLLVCARLASAQCVLPPPDQMAGSLTTPAAKYTQALTYVDHRCFSEARALLAEAAAGLASQTGGKAATLRNLVSTATEYVGALEAIDQGRRSVGYASLQRILDRGPNVVSLRAAIALGTALLRDADATRWRSVEEPLQELSRRGYVEADLILIERRVYTEGVPAAIARVEQQLASERAIQRSLSLQVLLVELYARADRFLDAQLLLASLERDAADTLLDLGMRKRLLTVGLAVSSALVSQGRSEFISQRDAYTRALAEINRFSS